MDNKQMIVRGKSEDPEEVTHLEKEANERLRKRRGSLLQR